MTRLRIALVSLAVALSMFAPAAAQPAVVSAASEEVAAVFSFDFSGSIFCLKAGKPYSPCTPINDDLADSVDVLAQRINNQAEIFSDRALTFKVAVYGNEGKFRVIEANSQRCVGNTSDKVQLLVSCLQSISALYRDKSNQLGATFYAQNFDALDFAPNVRCGLILFTDGKPDDKPDAEQESSATSCAVLPVAIGSGIAADTENWLEDTFTQTELEPFSNCTESIVWQKVLFESSDAAAEAIAEALEKIACLASIPSYACFTVSEIVELLEGSRYQFIVNVAPGVVESEFPIGIPLPGTTIGRGEELEITASTPTRPASCPPEPSPTPSTTPIPEIKPESPCVALFPSIQWLGCNLWLLALIAVAVILRFVWISMDMQVSINGKPNVGLRGGRLLGFNIQDAGDGFAAVRTPNPTVAQVKVSRSFIRFWPGTMLDRTGLNVGTSSKGNKFRFSIGDKVELKPGVTAVFTYGNPSKKPAPRSGSGSAVSSSESKPRNKAL
jgi:hypothetical protein